MSSPAVTVTPRTSIVAAGRVLLEANLTALPVVDGRGRVVGMVSRSDLLRRRVVADPRAHLIPVPEDTSEPPQTVAEVMTSPVVTVLPSTDDAEAAHLMQHHRIKSIPVVQGVRLLGMVSITDILRAKVRDDASIAEDVREALLAYAGAHGSPHVRVEDGVVTIGGRLPERERNVMARVAQTVPGVVRVRMATFGPSAPDLRAG